LQQRTYAGAPFAVLGCFCGLQIVQSTARVCILVENGFGFQQQIIEQRHEYDMLVHIGEISGVVNVAVVHGSGATALFMERDPSFSQANSFSHSLGRR
jgi:hypothetical protein